MIKKRTYQKTNNTTYLKHLCYIEAKRRLISYMTIFSICRLIHVSLLCTIKRVWKNIPPITCSNFLAGTEAPNQADIICVRISASIPALLSRISSLGHTWIYNIHIVWNTYSLSSLNGNKTNVQRRNESLTRWQRLALRSPVPKSYPIWQRPCPWCVLFALLNRHSSHRLRTAHQAIPKWVHIIVRPYIIMSYRDIYGTFFFPHSVMSYL